MRDRETEGIIINACVCESERERERSGKNARPTMLLVYLEKE